MKIRRIKIDNFKAIKKIEISDLKDTVVIAGPNGCGKSCIFDAIRLVKSVYGGYRENEWQQWFGEFQINVNALKEDVKRILNDKTKPLSIAVCFEITESEKNYLILNGKKLIEKSIWKSIFPEELGTFGSGNVPVSQQRYHQSDVDARKKKSVQELLADIKNDLFWGRLNVSVDGELTIAPCPVLELSFSSYDPENIGFIDYHGANRAYSREQFGNINLNIKTTDESMKNHALYNSAAKYSNVKSEMAGAYIRELIAKDADVRLNERQNIIETLKELFEIFFPGKTFLGPRPTVDGSLSFPVELSDGSEHDINELSSGEKEVLYGYLRIQNTSPKNSVLLLDEPELHLNPRLIRGLPKFYQKHLGVNYNNQIWLVTHSDAFLRETVGEPGFSVYHMRPPLQSDSNGGQIVGINANSGLDAALIDLVGDLASYSPNSIVVIFEGGGDSDFDLKMVATLFPDLVTKINAISGENKTKVRQLHRLLEKAANEDVLPYEFFSIVDRDTDVMEDVDPRRLVWDVYHIENYLLDSHYISVVINDLKIEADDISEIDIELLMKECAQQCMGALVTHELTKHINGRVISCVNLGIDPRSSDPDELLAEAVLKSCERIKKIIESDVSLDSIRRKKNEIETRLLKDIENDRWKKTFRGRDILKSMLGAAGLDVKYETFRNLIIARMRDDNYKPAGMTETLGQIIPE